MPSDVLMTRRQLQAFAGVIELWMEKTWSHPLIYGWAADVDWTTVDRIWISAKILNDEGTRPPGKGTDYIWVRHPVPVFHYTAYEGCETINDFVKRHMVPDKHGCAGDGILTKRMVELTRLVSDHYVEFNPDGIE